MAKIFRTEVLAVGGDNIRLTASEDGKFAFKAVNNDGTTGDDVLSLDQVSSDINSLNTKVTAETNARGSDIDSLATDISTETTNRGNAINQEGSDRADAKDALDQSISTEASARAAAITSSESTLSSLVSTEASNRASAITNSESTLSSLVSTEASNRASAITNSESTLTSSISSETSNRQSALTSESQDRGSDVYSLNSKLDSDISSLNSLINLENVFATGVALSKDAENVEVTFPNGTFSTAPSCVATIRGEHADDPMVGVMLSGTASSTSVKFGFTDPIPTTTMKLDILASV